MKRGEPHTITRAATAQLATPGALLAGRYRLDRRRASRARSTLWRAVDEVLSRPVAVRLVPLRDPGTPRAAGDPPSGVELVDAVSKASRAADRRLARVFDVAVDVPDDEPGGTAGQQVGVVVSEWVGGRPLSDLLHDGPLPAAEAVAAVDATAAALVAAAGVGAHHGRLHAGNVLVTADGVRVADLGVAAVVAGDPEGSDEIDARALGRLLFLSLTGVQAPRAGGGGKRRADQTAPRGPDRRARQLCAGIPRDVDASAMALLAGETAPRSAAGVRDLLAALPHQRPGSGETSFPDPDVPPEAWLRRPRSARRWAVRSLAVAGLAAVGLVGWLAGTTLGRVPHPRTQVPSISGPSAANSSQTALRPIALRGAPISAYDPQGDGHENDDDAGLAVDRDPSTSWTTSNYRGNPVFGGLKHGVGLLVDLGKPTRVRQVRLALDTPGASLQVRAADAPGSSVVELPTVASKQHAGRSITLTPRRTNARYWLVWLTRLPQEQHGEYAEGIAEIRFFR